MDIELIESCYLYQRRWIWHLSSLLQQVDPPSFIVNVAYVENSGDPTMEEIMAFYEVRGIRFRRIPHKSMEEMAYRDLTRNRQIPVSEGKLLFFADPDLVYSPTFLRGIVDQIKQKKSRYRVFFCADKVHTDKAKTQGIVDSQGRAMYIDDAYMKAMEIPTIELHSRNVAAGCMQVVHRDVVMEKTGGRYVMEDKGLDWHMYKWRTWSDIYFRVAVGSPSRIKLDTQVHLNHFRGKDPEWDPEMQR